MIITTLKKTAVVSAISGTILLSTIIPAFAQTTTAPTLGARGTARCQQVVNRVNSAVARAQDVENRWDTITTRWQNLNTQILAYLQKNNPSSVSQYQTDVTNFTNALGPVKTDAQNYTSALTSAQSAANSGQCGVSAGAFRSQVQLAVTARKQIKTDTKAARTAFQTLKQFIQSLRPVSATSAATATPTQ